MNSQSSSKPALAAVSLGAGTFAMMNITTVVSLRGLAAEAEYGLAAVFLYLFAALCFLVPVSLCAAELATGWPQKGGVFRWIGQAFGDRYGLLAIFLQWLATTICFPTMLIFTAVALAYALPLPGADAHLASNAVYTLGVVLVVYWLATWINLRGVRSASRISAIAGMIGTLIPAAILIGCGILYIARGNPVHFTLGWDALFPNITHLHNLVLAASVFLFYSGMEINAVHVRELNNASRNYPLAIGISALLTVVVLVLGTLTISALIPADRINLVQSLLVAYDLLFSSLGVPWLGHVVALMVAVGVLGQVTVIVAGPSRGLFEVGREGYLPSLLQQSNRSGVQRNILLLQGAIVTLMAIMLVCLPSVQAAFQILGQLAAILYLLMYILMFAAVITLRYTQPNTPRPYRIPGGNAGVWLVAGVGLVAALLAFVLSFIPPDQIPVGSPARYVLLLLGGTAAFVALPLLLHAYSQRSTAHSGQPHAGV
ncbi:MULTISPECIES: putative glutamine/gamma-aminobutyrate antiporter GadC [Edwardsiella]|uniref:Amino acid permease n=2 Tax=Edwardsiella anguillarum TaxID=1821960 RepID=A0ABY8SJ28_9GAMM|nr:MULTISPECIES: putative glutamine/gamma-aminobutyrate antiporter GadC [Edwardsiella]AKM48668.1 amino acid transporter [Edwardsiella sp. EA181011]GAJ66725.1 putative glutamate/gamma-aminobutyrate antiporter [Edwardsiella piscicida]AIJ08983.1 putative glutamate/gamma-aminobutyrate antiporter [Edwardsiella anguillarum ET080813]AKR76956.1 amino acid permease [Edwardsiella sp. LADL05-105]KAB0592260.1 amino acid permease [Edwardsiella anguillarum]